MLFFSGAFIPQKDGAHARVTGLLDRLVAEFPKVAVYGFTEHAEYPWDQASQDLFRARWPAVELVIEACPPSVEGASKKKKLFLSLDPGAADRVLRQAVAGATPKWQALQSRAAAVVVNYAAGLLQLNGVDPSRCFVETHDLNFLKAAKLGHRSPISLASFLRMRWELGVLDRVRGVFAISPGETSFFRMMLLAAPGVFYVSSWERPQPAPAISYAAQPEFDLVFVGSAYAMNARGLTELFAAHGDWLSRYKVVVAGRVCECDDVAAMAKRFPNVTLLGYVEDVDAVYARAKAALSPVDGTGMKMKIAAAVAAGLPVFASAHSMDGMPEGYDGAIFPIDAAQIDAVLGDPARLDAARAAARRYHEVRSRAGDTDAAVAAIRQVLP